MRFLSQIITIFLICILLQSAQAQFYSGTKQSFGKNRPRYNQFFWTYHRTSQFDVYYYQGGEEQATYLTNFAQKEISRLESVFRQRMNERIIFLTFNRLSDMRQSNIGLISGKEEHNFGGTTQIFNNKVTIYFEASYREFEQQVSAVIADIFIRQILLSGSNKSFWEPNEQGDFPTWFIKGLRSYLAYGWSTQHDEMLKILNQQCKIKRLNDFSGDNATLVGQAFWYYFTQVYGLHAIPECLSYASFYDNHVKALKIFTGKKGGEIMLEFEQFWDNRFASHSSDSLSNSNVTRLAKLKKDRKIIQLGISPDGKSVAWIENNNGRKILWVKNTDSGKRRRVFQTDNRLNQLQDNTFPAFCWHPNSRVMAFTSELKGELVLYIIELDTKQFATRKLSNVSKVLSLAYSPDANQIILSAIVAGKTDLLNYSIPENKLVKVTNSIADEYYPTFLRNTKTISFVSNKIDESNLFNNTLGNEDYFDRAGESIWILNASGNSRRLNHRKHEVIKSLNWERSKSFSFTSDFTGQTRMYVGNIDSTISRIDTAIHYTYGLSSKEININTALFKTASINQAHNMAAFISYGKNRNEILVKSPVELKDVTGKTQWRDELERGWVILKSESQREHQPADSVYALELLQKNSPKNDDFIDVYSWVFEKEKLRFLLSEQGFSLPVDGKHVDRISKIGYNITFYPNKIVNQVDFGFLSTNYQPYTGAPAFFNPGLNLNFIVGANDLFEDYRLYGGVSFGADFESNEFLLMFEYLGGTFKHQLAFHRQSYSNFDFTQQQNVKSNEFIYISRYPFSQVSSVGGGISMRYDNIIIPSTNLPSLMAPSDQRYWTGLKANYIYDNSNTLGFNLLEGQRFKIFAETQLGLGHGKRADLYTMGVDFRTYFRLFRETIFAARFAASGSLGYAGLVYYLGSVDNWVNFNPMIPNFDQSVAVNNSEKLMFQALATNLRGFSQNIRNGPNFGVINTEIRVPVIKTLTNRVIGSKLFNSLQIVGFFDAGSAWKGLTPWHGENIWEESSVTNGPVTVTFKTQRSPLVAGFGAGLRLQSLGYPLRFDYAWGIESGKILPPIFYFSTSIDF